MKAKFLISTITIIVLATIFSFTGCGDGKTVTTPIIDKPVESTNNQETEEKKEDPVVTKKPYCVAVKNIGTISGAIVVSEKGDKGREVDGKYCFDEKPQTVKIAGVGGVDSILGITTKCDSMKLDFIEDEALECSSKIPNLNYDETFLVSRERAIMFRSYVGDVYELMNVSFKTYDPIVLKAIEATNITSAKKILDDANITGTQNGTKKEEIVNLMVDLVASPINREVVTVAILALKSTAQLQDGNLTNGDNGITQWISENRDIVEQYILAHDGDAKTREKEIIIDLRKFVTQIIKLQRTKMLGTPTNLAELEVMIDPNTIMKFNSDTNIIRGPVADIITLKGSLDNSGVALNDIHFMNKIDGVTKYYENEDDKQTPELFTLFQEYIHFKEDINQSLDKYTLIKEYLKNLFTINLKLEYNNSKELPLKGKELLATAILDFPCKSECADKTEYLTLTFPIHVEEKIDGELSFVIEADKNITLTSRIWDTNETHPSFNRSIINVVNHQSNQLLESDSIDIDIVEYIDRASKRADANHTDLAKSIKDLLVRHTSNARCGEPIPMTHYLSLIDITDSATIPTTFIKNNATINPSDYDLDKVNSFYKDIFTEMYQNEKSINVIAIKTCFSCLE